MIISRVLKKPLTKFNNLHYKSSEEIMNTRNIPQHDNYIWQTYSLHHIKHEKIETVSSKVKNKTSMPTHSSLIKYSVWLPIQNKWTRKGNKRDTSRKASSILSLFSYDIILYLKYHKDLDLITNFDNVAEYKINIKISVAFFIYQQQTGWETGWERNQENNPIHNSHRN
jgi:hypothetical protein